MSLFHNLKTRVRKKLHNLISHYNSISRNTIIGESVKIIGSEISGNVEIGDNCKIRYAKLRGDIKIGRYTALSGRNIEIVSQINKIEIGSFCSIASNVSIQEFNHSIEKISTFYIQKHIFGNLVSADRNSKGNVIIGNDVWIGKNAMILSGVKIGNGAIIGANAVVSKDIPAYSIVGGVPSKIIKYRFSSEVISELERLAWWTWPVTKIKDNIELFEKENLSLTDFKDFQ